MESVHELPLLPAFTLAAVGDSSDFSLIDPLLQSYQGYAPGPGYRVVALPAGALPLPPAPLASNPYAQYGTPVLMNTTSQPQTVLVPGPPPQPTPQMVYQPHLNPAPPATYNYAVPTYPAPPHYLAASYSSAVSPPPRQAAISSPPASTHYAPMPVPSLPQSGAAAPPAYSSPPHAYPSTPSYAAPRPPPYNVSLSHSAELQRPVFQFQHAPGSLYHQRFQAINAALLPPPLSSSASSVPPNLAAAASDSTPSSPSSGLHPSLHVPTSEISKEGVMSFSMTGDNFTPAWMVLHGDFLFCLERRDRSPLWKITLWGTAIEPFTKADTNDKFMIITGLGQVFSFQADSPFEAREWLSAIRARGRRPSAPSVPSSSAPAPATAKSVGTQHRPAPAPAPSVPSPSPPPAVAKGRTSPVRQPASRRSASGIGTFFSALFESEDERDGAWVKDIHKQADPAKVAYENLTRHFSSPAHTLGKAVDSYVLRVNAKASGRVEDFDSTVRETLDFMRDALPLVTRVYPDLASLDDIDEITHRALEVALMPRVHKIVSHLYELKYQAENERHSSKNKEFLTVSPAHLGIPRLFWLSHTDNGESLRLSEKELEECMPPYYVAIETLKRLPTLKSATLKLDCVVQVGKQICLCINKFWEGRVDPSKLVVGADDLVPIMSYVVIKANLPSLYSEAMLMQDFMSEQAAMEIGGYSLATLQTCLSHLMELEKKEVLQNGEEELTRLRKPAAAASAAATAASEPVGASSVSSSATPSSSAAPAPASASGPSSSSTNSSSSSSPSPSSSSSSSSLSSSSPAALASSSGTVDLPPSSTPASADVQPTPLPPPPSSSNIASKPRTTLPVVEVVEMPPLIPIVFDPFDGTVSLPPAPSDLPPSPSGNQSDEVADLMSF